MRRIVLYIAVLLCFLLGIPIGSGASGAPDIFGLDVGNTWTYQSISNDGRLTTRDLVVGRESHMSKQVYVLEKRENGLKTETQWLEIEPGRVKLWGGTVDSGGPVYTMRFSAGLLQAWYPMHIGEERFTTAMLTIDELPGKAFNASLALRVIGRERISLSFGTFTAFKIQCRMRVWGNGADETARFVQWNVPYLGCAKYEIQDSVENLVSFSIDGGAITENRDWGTLFGRGNGPATSPGQTPLQTPNQGAASLANRVDTRRGDTLSPMDHSPRSGGASSANGPS